MRVLEIEHDGDHYQFFMPVKRKGNPTFGWFDGTPKSNQWSPPEVFIYAPKLKRSNFYYPYCGALIADKKATDALRELFSKAGELLPVPYKDELYYLLNVTTVIDCLDAVQTEWRTHGVSKKAVFRPEALAASPSPIFKIPQEIRTSVFVIEDTRGRKSHSPRLFGEKTSKACASRNVGLPR